MLTHCNCLRIWHCSLYQPPGFAVTGKGQHHLNFGILRKCFSARQVKSAATFIDPVVSLLGAAEGIEHPLSITHEELRGIHENRIAVAGFHFEAPEDGAPEGLFNGATFCHISGNCPVTIIGLNHQYLLPDALKEYNMGAAEFAAIK